VKFLLMWSKQHCIVNKKKKEKEKQKHVYMEKEKRKKNKLSRSQCIMFQHQMFGFRSKGMLVKLSVECKIDWMFPYGWPFDFNCPRNDLSFVAKPSYNP